MSIVTTYLKMRSPDQLRPKRCGDERFQIREKKERDWRFNRDVYLAVGEISRKLNGAQKMENGFRAHCRYWMESSLAVLPSRESKTRCEPSLQFKRLWASRTAKNARRISASNLFHVLNTSTAATTTRSD
jgi:hypothetical protein